MQVKTYLTESTGVKIIQTGTINSRGVKGPGYSLTIGFCFPAWAFRSILELLGPLTSDNRPCKMMFELVWDSRLITYLPFMEMEKWKKKKKKKFLKKYLSTNDNQANSWATGKFQNSSKRRSQRRCWHHMETPSAPWPHRMLLGGGVCACVCEPKPECQNDQGRGDKREECRLGLIRALLSGLRFLSITESGTKERDRGVWLEFQRALASAALSSLGLVWLVLLIFFPPLQIVRFVSAIKQRREERLFCKPEQHRFFFCSFYFIMVDTGWGRAERFLWGGKNYRKWKNKKS